MKNRTVKTGILDKVEAAHRNLLTQVIKQGFDSPVVAMITIDTLEMELRLQERLPID
jgi:hypothetical protein